MVRTESVIVRDNIRASQPTVLLIVGTEPLEPLLTFFREKCMSLSAERSYAQAVGRFVEWLSVRAGESTRRTSATCSTRHSSTTYGSAPTVKASTNTVSTGCQSATATCGGSVAASSSSATGCASGMGPRR